MRIESLATVRGEAKNLPYFALGILWLLVSIGGFAELWHYGMTPGGMESGAARWPESSLVPGPKELPLLVLFLHPQCPCSRATVRELAVLMAHCQKRLEARVIFLDPEGMKSNWVQSELWYAARAIPGVEVWDDVKGQETELFGVKTSGEARVFDVKGRLRFQGGLTWARGHEGDNDGRKAVEDYILKGMESDRIIPVFGCSLQDATARLNAKENSFE
jgi:hypothetical protein